MTQFNPKLRYDSNPDSIWDSVEYNRELTSIDQSMSTIPGILIDTISTQSINGQKTLFQVYTDAEGLETYESYMYKAPVDVSPVFGAGNISFELDGILEFGGYTKPNVSGYIFNMTPLNPSFIKGNILVESLSDNELSCTLGNLALIEYDTTRDGTLPPLLGNSIEVRNYLTSVTKLKTTVGLFTNSAYVGDFTPDTWIYLIGFYSLSTGNFSLGYISARSAINLDQTFQAFRKIGIYKIGTSLLEYVLHCNGYEYFTSSTISDTTLSNYTKSLGVDVISELLINNSSFNYTLSYQETSSPLYRDIPASQVTTESSVTSKSNFAISYFRSKVPYIYESNGELSLNPILDSGSANIKRLNHGDIIL